MWEAARPTAWSCRSCRTARTSPPESVPQSTSHNRFRLRDFVMPATSTSVKENSTMHLIGYARVSTSDQSLDRQLDELRTHGCHRVFAEAASGKRGAHRPQWDACLGHLRAGDTL